ncbi:MAG: DEAD/DEAH box helicase [Treponema sp.]|jgi:ATP-dependent Lhr-like helicase|nr:DEAD/DEAH box helicase [Treponema sp.]
MLPQTFHPIIRRWFSETYGNPTSVQAESWPLIESGENVLALAPTGSGKTLTAFLSAISRFCSPAADSSTRTQYPADKLSVLYISPLKALNEDIKRNLLEPLAAIKVRFEKEGLQFPPIRVQTRSGDTPQSERRRFFIHPPSILALTPESLSILLLNPKGRQTLSYVKYVIIDEIHAILGNKRGAFLSCQIDRLALIAGEFQRISLSATVRNPEAAADFIAGIGRKVRIAAPPAEKKIELHIEYPDISIEASQNLPSNIREALSPSGKQMSRYAPLISYILSRIWEGSTLLVFAESRRRAERLCYFLNQAAAEKFTHSTEKANRVFSGAAAYPHHGSLSKEIRRSVEKGFSEGKIPCVIATASLELGIDIGWVDEVVLAGSTGNVSQALQRIGRSGHSVGKVSRGKLFAFHGMDLLAAAALKDAVDERDIEDIYPIENPLDILAQLILVLCSEKERNIDELYELINKFYIFKNLKFESFNRVIRMLAGLGSAENSTRLREIKPRIWLDKIEGKIGVTDGTTTLLYTSGGVIANRGLYSLRLADGTKIGELDEEFVWERRIGDCFDFGARGWRIKNISSESVEVTPLENVADFIPFWKGDIPFRSINLTNRILAILENFNNKNDIKTHISAPTRESLKAFLESQRTSQQGLPLPDTKNIAVEIVKGTELNRDFYSIILHNFRGGQLNYPLSLALSSEMEETIGLRVECFPSDDNILFLLPRHGLDDTYSPEKILRGAIIALENTDTTGISRGERFFRNRLESSALFGANFREAAERSLLIPKSPFGKRTPLWIIRQRSKRLFDAVVNDEGFPATAEAWRSCLVDSFDMDGFRDLISSINNGSITLSFFQTILPSPFSANIVRQETNNFMYEYDERKDLAGKNHFASLSDKVIEDAIGNEALRPVLKTETINNFVSRLRREIAGWAPEDSLALNEWVKERIAIPSDEWKILKAAIPETVVKELDENKIKNVTCNDSAIVCVVHREWEENWKNEPLSLLSQWLRYEGPVSIERICSVFGVNYAEAEDAVNALVEVDEVVRNITAEDTNSNLSLICDRENLEMLLRLSRKKQRLEIKERPASMLVPFLALRQGLAEGGSGFRKNLYGWTAPAKLWETEILYARDRAYSPEKINSELRDGRLIWYGTGKEIIAFCRAEALDLVNDLSSKPLNNKEDKNKQPDITQLISSSFFDRPRDFWEIKSELSLDTKSCAQVLWQEVWRGAITADSFDPVRKGTENGFIPKNIELPQNTEIALPFGRQPRIPGALRNRWRNGAPVQGNWFSLVPESGGEISPLEEDALNRDRVRLLLDRWGVLCRPLLLHEAPVFSWSKLLPAMRRMELAGELIAGRIFAGINSLQFASPSVIAELERAETFDGFYWMNAADPASPAGLEIEGLGYSLCARNSSSKLYFKGAALIALSAKNSREIQIFMEADDSNLIKLIELFKLPHTRKVLPENKILIEKINGQSAAESVYAPFFKELNFVNDRGKLIYW